MGIKTMPSPYKNVEEAVTDIVSEFMSENIAGPHESRIRRQMTRKVGEALRSDLTLNGHRLPNRYEVLALNGMVPEDGRDFELDEHLDDCDYGCPEEVADRFPYTNEAIASEF